MQIFHPTVPSNRFTKTNWDKNQVKEIRLIPRKNLLKLQADFWQIHLTWRNGIYVKGLDRKVRKV